MILEAQATNCFSYAYLLKIDGRPLGKFSVQWLREGYKIQLSERRHLEFRRFGWLRGQYEMIDLRDEEVLAQCDRFVSLFSNNWNLQLSIGQGQLVSTGWLETAYEFIQEEVALARVDRKGRRDSGWIVDAGDALRVEDLLMIGLVYHTLHQRYYYRRDPADGPRTGT